MVIFVAPNKGPQMSSTVEFFRKHLGFAKPFLEAIFSLEARLAEWWVSGAHHRLFLAEWGIHPVPEYFDHKIGLYGMWRAKRNAHWVERGVFSLLAMEPGCRALELCCGDGFNAHFFYSSRVSSMLSVDFDPKAIAYAKKNFRAENVTYQLADIRTQMPEGIFDNIVWDAAIEHFTEAEIAELMGNIKRRLTPTGILSGFTIVERSDGRKMLVHHEYEFKSKEDLARFFRPHFRNVKVFETVYPDRHNLYFWASDGIIPFMPEWPAATN